MESFGVDILLSMVNAQIQAEVPEKYRPYVARRQRQKVEVRSRLKARHQAGVKQAQTLAGVLKSEFGATKVALFGSMLSASNIHMDSDIDLAVWGLSFSDYLPALSRLLTEAKEFSVDLVRIEEASHSLALSIEKGLVLDAVLPLSDVLMRGRASMPSYNALIGRIRLELSDIEEQYIQTKSQVEVARETGQVAYWMAVSLGLHGIYTGLEKIFQQIAREVDGDFNQQSERGHKALLEQMASEMMDVRSAVIDKKTFRALDKYLSFRHVVRSNYAYRLEPERIDDNFQTFENCYASLRKQLAEFCRFLSLID